MRLPSTLLRPAVLLAVAIAALSSLGAGPRTADALTNCSVADLTFDSQEQAFLTLINNYRAQNGLGALQTSVNLNRAASWLAKDMADKNYFSHTDSLNRSLGTRLSQCDDSYSSAGENIAAGTVTDTAQKAFDLWVNSEPHRLNMLNLNWKQIGIARYYNGNSTYKWYWVTDFHAPDDLTRVSGGGGGSSCAAPTIQTMSDTNNSGGGSVTFSWGAVPGASTYRITRRSGSSWVGLGTTANRSWSGTDPSDDPEYRVYVATGTCTPTPGPATTFDPTGSGGTSCSAPSITATSDTDPTGAGTVSFSWSPVPGASTYRITRRSGSGWVGLGTTANTSWSGLDPTDDPDYRVYVASGTCTPIPGPATTFDP